MSNIAKARILNIVSAPLSSNEAVRIAALYQYEILDTSPEEAYNDLTRLAAHICNAPIAMIGFVDTNRQWFKSKVGLEAPQIERNKAFCAYTILQPDIFIVKDTSQDARFYENSLVTSKPKIRFYAGVPLITANNLALGTLCVMDYVARDLTTAQQQALQTLARQVMTQLELRRNVTALKEAIAQRHRSEEALRESEERYCQLVELSPETIAVNSKSQLEDVNAISTKLLMRAKMAEIAKLELEKEIAERQRVENQLLHIALHDQLTGLPNRTLFIDRLKQAFEQAQRQDNYLFAVLFLDLDRFKVINDSLGHLQGDQLLREIAERLKACLRVTDTAARLGGDEFTILLEKLKDTNDALCISNRIQQVLSLPFNLDGQEVFTSASIGIAFSEISYDKPEDLLRDADTAMYHAKSQGKARCTIFNIDMYTHALSRLQLETDLRRALDYQEFRVYYQPIVSLKSGLIAGFEALVRWQHPERGLVNPGEFISVAEETGLIVAIGYWMLYEACRQMQAWRECFDFMIPGKISVNLSVKQFLQPDLIQRITRILQATGLPASNLMLEITESVIMENGDEVITVLSQLREMGIELSIDDFGTGYSSLGRLHKFPINMLKIDRSFIDGMEAVSVDMKITEAIVTLAHKLAIDVTAEGVETVDQLALLRELKCEYGQGYFFSPPIDSEATQALMMTNPKW